MGYFKTSVEAGATIEVTKSYTKRVGVKARGGKEKPTAEEIEKVNQMNAERTLRLKINNNFGVDDPFITLTYRKDERPEPEKAKKDIKKLIDRLRKEFKKVGVDLKWVCVTEYLNKAIHHHLLINHIEGQDVCKWVRRLWKYGRPDFKYLDDTGQYKDLAAYLIKETSKTYKAKDGAKKQRYSCSRNLVMPTPKTSSTSPDRLPKRKARHLLMPSCLRGSEIAAPSGKFCMAMPSESASAPMAVIPASPESHPAYTTPTAMPSGRLCSVTASTSMVDLPKLLFGPSALLLFMCR